MTKYIPLLVALLLVGCGTDSALLKPVDVRQIGAPITVAQAATKDAQDVAQRLFVTGASAGSADIKFMQLKLSTVQTQLAMSQQLVLDTQEDADKTVKQGNATIGSQAATIKRQSNAIGHWIGIGLLLIPAAIAVWVFAPMAKAYPPIAAVPGWAFQGGGEILLAIAFYVTAHIYLGVGWLLNLL